MWEQWQADGAPVSASINPSTDHPHDRGGPDRSERINELERTIEDLEQELERQRRNHQSIIEQYESIIAEKNRKLTEDESPTDEDSRWLDISTIRAIVTSQR